MPLILTIAMLQGSPPSPALNACLGHFEITYYQKKFALPPICTIEDPFRLFICQGSFLWYSTMASNIPEAYMLYRCFQKIKESSESVHDMIGTKAYLGRRRENGIVIAISLFQWALELGNLVVYLCYLFFVYGGSVIMDKIFNVYLMAFGAILQLSFYLMGDKAFRTDLSNKGLMHALKIALIDR